MQFQPVVVLGTNVSGSTHSNSNAFACNGAACVIAENQNYVFEGMGFSLIFRKRDAANHGNFFSRLILETIRLPDVSHYSLRIGILVISVR